MENDFCKLGDFTVWIYLNECRFEIDRWIERIFSDMKFLEQQDSTVTYEIPKASMFGLVAKGYRNSDDILEVDRLRKETPELSEQDAIARALAATGNNPSSTAVQKSALGMLFGAIEKSKATYNFNEYAVSPSTLEQVFNNFVGGYFDGKNAIEAAAA